MSSPITDKNGRTRPSTSLGQNIIVPIFTVALLLFAGLVAIANYTTSQRAFELQKKEARSISHAITYAAQTVPELKQLNRFLASLGGHEDIRSIHIVDDKKGTIVSSTDFAAIGETVSIFRTLTRSPLDQSILDLAAGTFYPNSDLDTLTYCDSVDLSRWENENLSTGYGRVIITLDRSVGNRQINKLAHINTAAAAASVLVLLACTYALIRRHVLRPLQLIKDGLDSHYSGQSPFKKPDLANNEIGQLAGHLEITIDTILAQRQEAILLSRDLRFQKDTLDRHAIVSETDAQGNITYVNEAFCEISGLNREELVGQNHRILNSRLHSMEFWKHMYRQLARKGFWHGEIRNRAKDGSFYWVNTTIAAFKDEKGIVQRFVSVRTDITALKEAEFSLLKKNSQIERSLEIAKKAKREAENAANAKTQFLATMSHEIRTPMNGLIGVLHLVEEDLAAEKVELLQTAKSSADDLLVLINDILDFSKIDAGRMELESIPFDALELIESVCELHANTAQNKKLDLAIKSDPRIQHKLKGDPVRVRQIVSNLIGNAIKFTEHGFVSVALEIRENAYRISVSDTGVGIREKSLKSIFDSFTQENSSTTRKFGGTGLGLSICKKLVTLMGGTISVESTFGKGSTFSFEIPHTISVSKREHSEREKSLQQKNALLVLPDSHTKPYLESRFENWGIKVFTYRAGNQNFPTIDFVLLDIQHASHTESLWSSLKTSLDLAPSHKLILLNTMGADCTGLALEEYRCTLAKPINFRKLLDALAPPTVRRNDRTAADSKQSFARLKVLIVDDNLTNRLIASRMLKQLHGIKADAAASGAEGIELHRKNSYDIIFMDCMMPEMDGYAATQIIRDGEAVNDAAATPIIALTANAMPGDREKCENAGMDDYIAKPVAPTNLSHVLERWSPSEREESKTAPSPLDLKKLNKVYRGDRSSISAMLNLFEESMSESLALFDKALKSGDTEEDARFYAHRIHGSAAEIGAPFLAHLARELETYCIQQNHTEIARTFDSLLAETNKVLVAIDEYKGAS